MDMLSTIISGIFIAVISSLVTVHLSLKKFRTEKLWEKRAEAYQNILEALHNSKRFCDVHIDAEIDMTDVSEERDNELRNKSKIAHDEILKAIDIGTFLLSEEALARLQKYITDISYSKEAISWTEYLENDSFSTSQCLNDLKEIAKNDLKI